MDNLTGTIAAADSRDDTRFGTEMGDMTLVCSDQCARDHMTDYLESSEVQKKHDVSCGPLANLDLQCTNKLPTRAALLADTNAPLLVEVEGVWAVEVIMEETMAHMIMLHSGRGAGNCASCGHDHGNQN
jgi:hypothetical protein